ncbi:site-specific integrase [Methylobacterium sp. WL9]|uniref:site-specific integrase n=1 Tax=Methylobacterium sp. WL9 TaxID=2603898 RepID=UPI0011C7660A|nr:site-specific integrase [Methylobacterium sp. WL9]TXN24105.1 site-specific integrase [Methylobacterium sp. WL9]
MAKPIPFDTIAKRARLATSRNPYWHGVSGGRGGVSLGYRKPRRGSGAWVVKLVIDGKRIEERLAPADDADAEDGALTFPAAVTAALAWARSRVRALEDESFGERAAVATVAQALEAYTVVHAARIGAPKSYMAGTFRNHVAPHRTFADCRLDRLTTSKIHVWRAAFTARAAEVRGEPLTARTINSVLSQVRAALNHAVDIHRASLPPTIAAEIKHGTKAVPGDRNARDHQILPDFEIRRLVEAAFAIDETGDFGRLILILAATGARISQIARLTVSNVQVARSRILMPPAKKGRRPKDGPPAAIPIGGDVVTRLEPILNGRRGHEPLLLHWHHARTEGAAQSGWARVDRRPWSSSSAARHEWEAAVKYAGAPPATIMMCFRHSSIVRGLAVGLPVRLVAALHDTSVEMIEEHYSAHIVDATEELARRAITPLTSIAVTPLRPVAEAAA